MLQRLGSEIARRNLLRAASPHPRLPIPSCGVRLLYTEQVSSQSFFSRHGWIARGTRVAPSVSQQIRLLSSSIDPTTPTQEPAQEVVQEVAEDPEKDAGLLLDGDYWEHKEDPKLIRKELKEEEELQASIEKARQTSEVPRPEDAWDYGLTEEDRQAVLELEKTGIKIDSSRKTFPYKVYVDVAEGRKKLDAFEEQQFLRQLAQIHLEVQIRKIKKQYRDPRQVEIEELKDRDARIRDLLERKQLIDKLHHMQEHPEQIVTEPLSLPLLHKEIDPLRDYAEVLEEHLPTPAEKELKRLQDRALAAKSTAIDPATNEQFFETLDLAEQYHRHLQEELPLAKDEPPITPKEMKYFKEMQEDYETEDFGEEENPLEQPGPYHERVRQIKVAMDQIGLPIDKEAIPDLLDDYVNEELKLELQDSEVQDRLMEEREKKLIDDEEAAQQALGEKMKELAKKKGISFEELQAKWDARLDMDVDESEEIVDENKQEGKTQEGKTQEGKTQTQDLKNQEVNKSENFDEALAIAQHEASLEMEPPRPSEVPPLVALSTGEGRSPITDAVQAFRTKFAAEIREQARRDFIVMQEQEKKLHAKYVAVIKDWKEKGKLERRMKQLSKGERQYVQNIIDNNYKFQSQFTQQQTDDILSHLTVSEDSIKEMKIAEKKLFEEIEINYEEMKEEISKNATAERKEHLKKIKERHDRIEADFAKGEVITKREDGTMVKKYVKDDMESWTEPRAEFNAEVIFRPSTEHSTEMVAVPPKKDEKFEAKLFNIIHSDPIPGAAPRFFTRQEALEQLGAEVRKEVTPDLYDENMDDDYEDEDYDLLQDMLSSADYRFFEPEETNDVYQIAYDGKNYIRKPQHQVLFDDYVKKKKEQAIKQASDESTLFADFRYGGILWEKTRSRKYKAGVITIHTKYIVAGNLRGCAAWGKGRAVDDPEKAWNNALRTLNKNLLVIPLHEGRTLHTEAHAYHNGAHFYIAPTGRYEGFSGCPLVEMILTCFGIKDACTKLWGHYNKVSQIEAVFKGIAAASMATNRDECVSRGKNWWVNEPGKGRRTPPPTREDMKKREESIRAVINGAFSDWEERKAKYREAANRLRAREAFWISGQKRGGEIGPDYLYSSALDHVPTDPYLPLPENSYRVPPTSKHFSGYYPDRAWNRK